MQPGLERSQQTSLQSLPTSPFASRSSPSPVLAHFVRSHLSFSNGLVIGSVWRKLDQIPAPFRFLPSSNKDKSPRRANILVPSRLRASTPIRCEATSYAHLHSRRGSERRAVRLREKLALTAPAPYLRAHSSVVNAPPPKGGGFGLRLKAG